MLIVVFHCHDLVTMVTSTMLVHCRDTLTDVSSFVGDCDSMKYMYKANGKSSPPRYPYEDVDGADLDDFHLPDISVSAINPLPHRQVFRTTLVRSLWFLTLLSNPSLGCQSNTQGLGDRRLKKHFLRAVGINYYYC